MRSEFDRKEILLKQKRQVHTRIASKSSPLNVPILKPSMPVCAASLIFFAEGLKGEQEGIPKYAIDGERDIRSSQECSCRARRVVRK